MKKFRTKEEPYAIFKNMGPFGNTEVRLLKVWQMPKTELKNQYAKWNVAVKSDYTFGSFDMGDSYLNDVVRNLDLTYAHELFKNQYWNYLHELKNKAGFNFSIDNAIPSEVLCQMKDIANTILR